MVHKSWFAAIAALLMINLAAFSQVHDSLYYKKIQDKGEEI